MLLALQAAADAAVCSTSNASGGTRRLWRRHKQNCQYEIGSNRIKQNSQYSTAPLQAQRQHTYMRTSAQMYECRGFCIVGSLARSRTHSTPCRVRWSHVCGANGVSPQHRIASATRWEWTPNESRALSECALSGAHERQTHEFHETAAWRWLTHRNVAQLSGTHSSVGAHSAC